MRRSSLKFALTAAAAAWVAVPAPVAAEVELDIPGSESTSLSGDALVWEDATFFLEPWDNGASVKISTIGRRFDEVGRAIPIRIVDASMKRFVEIALPDRLDCAWRRWAPDARIDALRLFVKREDLAPVLTRPFAAKASDGTEIKLGVGMPVAPTPSGAYTIATRGDKLRLPIPHASIGWTYTANTKLVEPEVPGTGPKVYRLDRSIPVKLLGDELTPRAFWYSPEPTRVNDQALLRWASRCVEMTVLAPNAAVRPQDRPRVLAPVKPSDPPPRPTGYYIPSGAPLATSTGREVGVAAKAIPVSAPSGDTSCFDALLSATKVDETTYPQTLSRTYRVCTPARLVERDP
ncbi:MAG: hypothetical protein KF773_05565 [Deltaproteobacteria bacterium]|nr:hypothetical protein [Deltaproteobacteria bacterium]MCW5808695.1 hypothetical protein [Deltaproteobacteria bacterium]